MAKFIKKVPANPITIGENLDNGPMKLVKFVPINDIAKSTIAKPTNTIPIKLKILLPKLSFCLTFIAYQLYHFLHLDHKD